ncbi:MAG: hypothetical protein ACRD0X_01015 [Thermoanaerobaculia bacterium]
MPDLKPLSAAAVPAALDKAKHYRLLNEPVQAESICRDVLALDPGHQDAMVTLVLALTDQFEGALGETLPTAREAAARLHDSYRRAYYSGIVCERAAAAHVRRGGPGAGAIAWDWLAQAMAWYEQAEPLRPPGNDDVILRWNSCVRTLERHPEMQPPGPETFQPLLE